MFVKIEKQKLDAMVTAVEVVSEHLSHGYVNPEDAVQLKAALQDVQAEVHVLHPNMPFIGGGAMCFGGNTVTSKPDDTQMLWGD